MTSASQQLAIDAIKKKLVGKSLSYNEIFAIMDEIANKRLSPVLTTYFAAAGFREGFSDEELYFLTRAMVDTGPKLHFFGLVADKHSTGGVAGSRISMVLVPIVAAAGFLIPKSSSRAITSPTGTADSMEVLAPVTFSPKQIQSIAEKVGGCIVWGGHLGLAPADDVIIQIEQPLAFESFDKIIVSIMAKKVASGATHVILDIPVGPTLKIQHFEDAERISQKFTFLASRFSMKVITDINGMRQTAGQGIGPTLEARDALLILEQHKDRPRTFEEKAIRQAGKLLSLCLAENPEKLDKSGEQIAREILESGKAMAKMREIIKAQGGNPDVESHTLIPGKYKFEVKALRAGRVTTIQNQQITIIARILGCPTDKKAGMYIHHKIDEHIDRGDILCTLYSSDQYRLKEAMETLKIAPIYTIE